MYFCMTVMIHLTYIYIYIHKCMYIKKYIYFNDCSSHSDIPPPPPTMRLLSIDSAHAKPPDARQGPWRRTAAAQQPGLEDVGIWRSGKDVWVCVKKQYIYIYIFIYPHMCVCV